MESKVLESAEEAGFATSPADSADDDYELLFGHKREAETPAPPSKRSRVEVKKAGISDTDTSSRESGTRSDDDTGEERDSVRDCSSPRVG